jgi:hypothetical protein
MLGIVMKFAANNIGVALRILSFIKTVSAYEGKSINGLAHQINFYSFTCHFARKFLSPGELIRNGSDYFLTAV